jgi:hypothetical protein
MKIKRIPLSLDGRGMGGGWKREIIPPTLILPHKWGGEFMYNG